MNIMVCYDGSEVAKEALELAKTHAKAFNVPSTELLYPKSGRDC